MNDLLITNVSTLKKGEIKKIKDLGHFLATDGMVNTGTISKSYKYGGSALPPVARDGRRTYHLYPHKKWIFKAGLYTAPLMNGILHEVPMFICPH